MNAIENKSLFSDISAEESSSINGGVWVKRRVAVSKTKRNPLTGRLHIVFIWVWQWFWL